MSTCPYLGWECWRGIQ